MAEFGPKRTLIDIRAFVSNPLLEARESRTGLQDYLRPGGRVAYPHGVEPAEASL